MGVTVVGPSVEQMGRSIGEWIKAATIETAFNVLAQEGARGFDREPVVITDGVTRRDPRQVKPFGKIEFVARTTIADAVLWALAELIRRSPIGPAKDGHYKDDHTVLINGAEVRGNIRVALTQAKAGDRIQIVNPRPYARKLEGATANKKTGRGGRRGSSRQARGGIYRPVLRSVVQRWGKSVYVEYKNVKLNLGVKVWGDQGGRYNRAGVKGRVKRVIRDQVYPALQFFVIPSQAVN